MGDQKLNYEDLSDCFVVFGAKKQINDLRNAKKSELNIAAVRFFTDSLGDKASLSLASAVNTESNLRSHVFENIALSLGIDPEPYSSKFNLIDVSLCDRRNTIAHGEYLDLNVEEYRRLATEVTWMMRLYLNDVSNAACRGRYRR